VSVDPAISSRDQKKHPFVVSVEALEELAREFMERALRKGDSTKAFVGAHRTAEVPTTGDDIQSALLRAMETHPRFKSKGHALKWLRTVAKNLSVDAARKQDQLDESFRERTARQDDETPRVGPGDDDDDTDDAYLSRDETRNSSTGRVRDYQDFVDESDDKTVNAEYTSTKPAAWMALLSRDTVPLVRPEPPTGIFLTIRDASLRDKAIAKRAMFEPTPRPRPR
jgi:DNA-directed RNA polymerase specialized sigma24 family protein